jgi:hypothetical protein
VSVPASKVPVTTTEATVDLYEIQRTIHPRSVRGWFAAWRVALVVLTQLVFYGTLWLNWNGRQAVLFDLASRKFYIFGLVFWPQDFIFLTTLLVISALALFLFTAVAGRLWCGYACPQTVYTEIFMWIERKVEGDRLAPVPDQPGAAVVHYLGDYDQRPAPAREPAAHRARIDFPANFVQRLFHRVGQRGRSDRFGKLVHRRAQGSKPGPVGLQPITRGDAGSASCRATAAAGRSSGAHLAPALAGAAAACGRFDRLHT